MMPQCQSQSNGVELPSSSMRLRKSRLLRLRLDLLDNINEGNFICVEIPKAYEEEGKHCNVDLYDRLRQWSNFASWLCLVDCTVLPLMTLLIPLLGCAKLGTGDNNNLLEWLNEMGHSVALLFVLPVGSLSTILNFASHRQAWIVGLSALGLALVAMANSHLLSGFVAHIAFLHCWHYGLSHRIVNVSGCALLLTTNYLSHQHIKAHNYNNNICCVLHPQQPDKKQHLFYQV